MTPDVANVEEFRIFTSNAAPTYTALRMVSEAHRSEVNSQIKNMLERNVIRVSSSPWLSPPVIVEKKGGGLRFCVDYRNVYKVTTKDAYPLPLPDQVQDKLHEACIFSKLDLNSGYWQIPIAECGREKTAFYMGPGLGLYEFNVLLFGLTGGPSACQRIMDKVLSGMDCTDNFIYDVKIFSPDVLSHQIALLQVFQRLRNHNFTSRPRSARLK